MSKYVIRARTMHQWLTRAHKWTTDVKQAWCFATAAAALDEASKLLCEQWTRPRIERVGERKEGDARQSYDGKTKAARVRQRYAYLLSKGICTRCAHEDARPGMGMCEPCARDNTERVKARRKALRDKKVAQSNDACVRE